MNRKSLRGPTTAAPEWDPNTKEPWLISLAKEPVNDERWSCIVTAAVQNEAQDEEIIQIYTQCVNTGLRKAVRVVSMADVTKLIKGSNTGSNPKKEEKTQKGEAKVLQTPKLIPGRFPQMVELAAKYATFTGNECKLPPDLMAALIKSVILNLKDENCLQKKMDAVRETQIREGNIKRKFIREAKPYKVQEQKKPNIKIPTNVLELDARINDEPIAGPDLYIMLTGFYNVLYLPQLQLINVPLLATLKISTQRDPGNQVPPTEPEMESGGRGKAEVKRFWEDLKRQCSLRETTALFKDIAMLEYEAPLKKANRVDTFRTIFDELTWMQYSAFCIFRQHQKYLRELQVQRLFLSAETLDLSKCDVYNKLCDALIIGEPITPLLVLYAMVEQVVVGVPETESVALEYPKLIDDSNSVNEFSEPMILLTPCKQCRNKKTECSKFVLRDNQSQSSEENEWVETSEENSLTPSFPTQSEKNSAQSMNTSTRRLSSGLKIFESLLNKVLNERKTEKETRDDKKWKAPSLCFYGDSVYSQTLNCDFRLFDSETIVERFLKNSSVPQIWANYPELSPEESALCNFHFRKLLKISNQTEELLKIKIFFTLAMAMIKRTKFLNSQEENPPEKLNISKLDQNILARLKRDKKSFPDYFFQTFIMEAYLRKIGIQKDTAERILESINKTPNQSNDANHIDPGLISKTSGSNGDDDEKILGKLYSILDCAQISNLTEPLLLNDEGDFLRFIQDFIFYEKLEPKLMIQRLVEAKENFNTIKCSYFAPTDTLILLMNNDSDERGIFDACECGVIPTPVALRDFYDHVYPDLGDWLVEEEADYEKFTMEQAEKLKARDEKKAAEYLTLLKRQYCEMSEEKRKEFLNTQADVPPLLATGEKDLGELPVKPKPKYRNKISFHGVNFTEFRAENRRRIREFHSRDGTRVNVTIDTWLYAPVELLKVKIQRSHLSLYYNQWMGQENNPDFTLKTDSDFILAFSKSSESEMYFNYVLTMSWPTGLMIRPICHDSGIYIKQSYLNPYRRGRQIEQEVSRCFLRQGKVIIFKKNGDYDILFGSGTKWAFHASVSIPGYDISSTTGEVWQIRTKGPCKNRKTLIATNKIFIGVDPNNKETFYKREDGVRCMLWPSGRLVTNYLDGTKITTTPYFDEEEVTVEWTEEEKLYFTELESKHKLDLQEPKSRTILRNSSIPKSFEKKYFNATGFVSVSCAYLMEHPKYSRICFNPNEPYIKITMPEELNVLMYPEGNYEVQQDKNLFTVFSSTVEFRMNCQDCAAKSSVTLNLDSNDTFCRFVDFFQKAFFVCRNGDTEFQEVYQEYENEQLGENNEEPKKSPSDSECASGHSKNLSFEQRCFSFERDLSGVEYLHVDSFAFHCHQLPEETYFELNTEDPTNVTHTFNSPYYKIGCEKWVMSYEENNSLPTNLKKKDMKEIGTKQVTKNTFKYPFPKHHNCGNQQQNEKGKQDVKEPKLIVSRTVECLSQNPKQVIDELQQYVASYREKAVEIFNTYRSHKVIYDRSDDSRYMDMRLRKIALTLTQSLNMYPHLCTNLPSTEKDIHYFGHFINSMETMKNHIQDNSGTLPNCKQIPNHLPRSTDFTCIHEENETQDT